MSSVALIGIGCRLPKASGPEELWSLLCDEVDAISLAAPGDDGEPAWWGGFADGLHEFDYELFGISRREAERMDPQQRAVLEVGRDALEDAGVPVRDVRGSRTGVYIGVSTFDHGASLLNHPEADAHDGTGGALSIVANRLSYCLDLRGPSMVVDTACSSSLVSVALACRAIALGEVDLALAGGVNVMADPDVAIRLAKAGLMADDGRCKPFDHRADGYVRGEGAGIVVLKPLERALADGDRVYCVVRGTAVNQDGRSNGLTAPNRLAQEDVLRMAYAAAGVDPADVGYVEAHGTGTAVGDPIEVGALGTVLGKERDLASPLKVGSVKSNIGHLEAAAGVAGLIKTALCVHRGALPATLHFEQPNPLLRLDRLSVEVQATKTAWTAPPGERLAGVSSFGFGGTNAHVVVSGVSVGGPEEPKRRLPVLMPLSSHSEEGLARQLRSWAETAAASAPEGSWWADASAAAALRHDHGPYRAAVVADRSSDGARELTELADGGHPARGVAMRRARRSPRIAFVFSGHGAQHPDMGRRLEETVPEYADAVMACRETIAGRVSPAAGPRRPLGDVATTQRALFASQVALARTWSAWGVQPAAVIGHSMGEVAAAHVAGSLTLADAARVICERSRLLAQVAGIGGMLLAELDEAEAADLVRHEPELSIAAVNGPRATVLSGPDDALTRLTARLEAEGVFVRRVEVDVPAHSVYVNSLEPVLRASLEDMEPSRSRLPIYSTVTASPADGRELNADYWVRNLRDPVLFGPTVERLLEDGFDTFVEIAPHPVLGRSLASIAHPADAVVVSSTRRGQDEVADMLVGLGELHASGVEINWTAVYPRGARHVELPRSPRAPRRFPISRRRASRLTSREPRVPTPTAGDRSVLDRQLVVWSEPALRIWPLRVDRDRASELQDHVFAGAACVPATYWLSAAVEACLECFGNPTATLEGVSFDNMKAVAEADPEGTQLTMRSPKDGSAVFSIDSGSQDGARTVHAQGAMRPADDEPETEAIDSIVARCRNVLPVDEQYGRLADVGLAYGPRFRRMQELYEGEGEAIGRVVPEATTVGGNGPLHPATLDACLHAISAILPGDAPVVPAGVERVWARGDGNRAESVWTHVRVSEGDHALVCDVSVLDPSGALLWRASRLEFARTRPGAAPQLEYRVDWRDSERRSNPAPLGPWLVLGRGRIADGVRSRLLASGRRPVDDVEDCTELCGVADLRALTEVGPIGEALERTTSQALLLAQELTNAARSDGARLWFATAGTQEPGSVETCGVVGGPLWGLARTLANEQPELGVSIVDFDWPIGEEDLDAFVGALCDSAAPMQSAIRGGRLIVPRLAPLRSPANPRSTPVRTDGVQLVTGGYGTIGLRVARWLVTGGARALLLIGRNAPGERAAQEIARLREEGVDVRVAQADLSDRPALERVAERALAGRPLRSIFHLAGVRADGLAANIGPSTIRASLSGKAIGAWNLHLLSRKWPVETFVMFASFAGLIGSPGQAAYAAANTSLEALALHRRSLGLPALSIDWGPWDGTGLAEQGDGIRRAAARGVLPLPAGDELRLLESALASGLPHVAAVALDRDAWRRTGAGPAAQEMVGDRGTDRPSIRGSENTALMASLVASDPAARQQVVRDHLVELVAQIVGDAPSRIDPGIPFHDLGFDSLMTLELRDALESSFGTKLSATLVWGHPTVEALAEEMIRRLKLAGDAPRPSAPASRDRVPLNGSDGPDVGALDDEQLADCLAHEMLRFDHAE